MKEAPLILFQLSLKHTATTVYSYSEEHDKRETHPWWTGLPIKSPVLTFKPGNYNEDSASFWSEIRDNLVSFHADYGFGFHDTMMSYLRSGVVDVVADNSGAGVVSVYAEMHLFTENTISDPSDMFGDITSFRVETSLESRMHNLKRFRLLSHNGRNQEVEEEEGDITCCAICLEDLFGDDQEEKEEEEGDVRGMKLVSCGHVFHEDCLVDWLKEKDQCPLCRHPSCLLVMSTDEQDQVKATV